MGRGFRASVAWAALVLAVPVAASAETPADIATAFAAGEWVRDIALSPDGSTIAMVVPRAGAGDVLAVRGIADDAPVKLILTVGRAERMQRCRWVSNKRVACTIHGTTDMHLRKVGFTRMIAIDLDGKNMKLLTQRSTPFTRGFERYGGDIVDWLPEQNDGTVLMAREHLPDTHTGSLVGSNDEGLAVDRLNTNTLEARTIEPPRHDATTYIGDEHGTIRIEGVFGQAGATEQLNGILTYYYRRPGSRAWEPLSQYNSITRVGFRPIAIDSTLDVAYGFTKKDGREAVYSVALDGSLQEKPILVRDDVDVSAIIEIGRRNRVVGASYTTDRENPVFFDADIAQVMTALHHAIPSQPNMGVVDSSADERKLLIFAGSDSDPGVYYLFDRDKKDLHIILPARRTLEGRALGTMAAIRYKAADGTVIPAYLTLPAGKTSAKGLPAIVMPHGGPSLRDRWGFDWLAQFFAAEGYAVLQPEFRGSSGYGDAWYQQNGFKSWRIAVGDVVDAGRWLAGEGGADPHRLAIFGWSYGGYAALQSAVIAPDLFKAGIAVAPVTDLSALKEESANWTDNALQRDFIGSGPHIHEGSPAQNADKIKAPVLLFHGTMDADVAYAESTLMDAKLKAAGDQVELITFDGLDHQLDDVAARTKLLAESDAFLRTALGK